MKSVSKLPHLLLTAFSDWQKNKVPVLGAALAYYSVFSLGPLLLVIIGILGTFFGREAIAGHIYTQLSGLLGKQAASGIETMIAHAAKPSSGIISIIVGGIILILGASGVFGQMQDSFNQIWHITPKSSGIKGFLKDRFLSFGMVAALAFLLGISLIASASISALTNSFTFLIPYPKFVLETVNFILSVVLLWLLFAFLYKTLSKVTLPWKYVFSGAFIASLLFSIGKTAIGLYIGHSSFSSTYGSSASLVILLLWVYYTSQILFYGIEFTKVHAEQDHAVSYQKAGLQVRHEAKQGTPLEEVPQGKQILIGLGYILVGMIRGFFVLQNNNKQTKRR